MKIYIDGDGCPVVNISVKIANEYGLECIVFYDTAHDCTLSGATKITVSKGADSVDFALVNKIGKNDIFITQDYALAAMCLAKGAYGIHQSGHLYTNENIDGLLMSRHIAREERMRGRRGGYIPKRTKTDDENFERGLISLIEKLKEDAEKKQAYLKEHLRTNFRFSVLTLTKMQFSESNAESALLRILKFRLFQRY